MMTEPITNSLKGCNAIITAGGSGLGKGIAQKLASQGAIVFVWDKDKKSLLDMEGINAPYGSNIHTEEVDLIEILAVKNVYEKTLAKAKRIDILINNAGGSLHTPFRFLDQSADDWTRVLNLNLMLTVQLTQLVLPSMIENHYGRIVNLGSKAGRYGSLFAGANYVAAKGAIHSLTLQIAQEFGPHGITCNAVCPGAVLTPRVRGLLKERQSEDQRQKILNEIPVRRHGEVEDVANTVAFLASREAEFITGVLLDVNGGQGMST